MVFNFYSILVSQYHQAELCIDISTKYPISNIISTLVRNIQNILNQDIQNAKYVSAILKHPLKAVEIWNPSPVSNFPTESSKLSKRRLDPNSDQIPAPFNYIGCEQRLTQICHFLHANAFSWPVKNATRSPLYLYLADCSDRITISFHSPPLYNTLNLNDLAYLQEGSFAIFLRLSYGTNIKI